MARYTIYFENGQTAGPMDLDALRGMVDGEMVGARDVVSAGAESSVPWYYLPELADLAREIAPKPDSTVPPGLPQGVASPKSRDPGPKSPVVQKEPPAPVVPARTRRPTYDPLADKKLSLVQIRDLLWNASLYDVMGVPEDSTEEEIDNAYPCRQQQIDDRQLELGESTLIVLAAIEDLRRLVYESFEKLRDPETRGRYDRNAVTRDVPAARYLAQHRMRSTRRALRDTGTYAVNRRVALLQGKEQEQEQEQVFEAKELFGNMLPPEAAVPLVETFERRKTGTALPETIGEAGRRVADEAEKAKRTDEIELDPAALFKPAPASSRVDEQGLFQVIAMFMVVLIPAMGILLATDLGQGDRFSSPTTWHYGRAGLLLVVAVIGTVVLRTESFADIGFRPAPAMTIVGVLLGLGIGFMASFIAPIRIYNTELGIIAALMFLQALSHEVFFRGFVVRVLLEVYKSRFAAIVIGGVMYGLFMMTFNDVMGMDLMNTIYFSLLVPGLVLGGLFGLLYSKSRSIWPSVIAHFLILFMAHVLAIQ
jgi:membrane protease YdiL (CAAX protease family)